MSDFKVSKIVLGQLDTNIYIAFDKKSKESVIVDPADEPGKIIRAIEKLGVKPVAIFLTHGHFDHILAANFLKNYYKIPIIAHNREKGLLKNVINNLSHLYETPMRVFPDYLAKNNEILEYAGFKFRVLYTPGHTRGSCCYYDEEKGILFSGDTMFSGSSGRCDFPTGDYMQMGKSITKLLSLDEEVAVFPGHGEQTSIGIERFYYQWFM